MSSLSELKDRPGIDSSDDVSIKTEVEVEEIEWMGGSSNPFSEVSPSNVSTDGNSEQSDSNFAAALAFKREVFEDDSIEGSQTFECVWLSSGPCIVDGPGGKIEILPEDNPLDEEGRRAERSPVDISFGDDLDDTSYDQISRPYSCGLCGASFARNGRLRTHMIIHSPDKPFTCSICNAKFTQKGHLKRHQLTHTKEKPLTCEICDAKFSRTDHLNGHLRIHTGVKPFLCMLCGAEFSRGTHLNKHLQRH